MYQLLDEEDNIKFMTMFEESTKNDSDSINKTNAEDNTINKVDKDVNTSVNETDKQRVLIKTETRTGYVNIDGTERDKAKTETNLTTLLKEHIDKYTNFVNELNETPKNSLDTENEINISDKPKGEANVEVDDIIVPRNVEVEKVRPPSSTKAKQVMNLLPLAIQEFLNKDWKERPKCEPQYLLDRIRKEKRYPDHPHTNRYDLLLTPAPSFLQRISLAGEFLNKKQLQV